MPECLLLQVQTKQPDHTPAALHQHIIPITQPHPPTLRLKRAQYGFYLWPKDRPEADSHTPEQQQPQVWGRLMKLD